MMIDARCPTAPGCPHMTLSQHSQFEPSPTQDSSSRQDLLHPLPSPQAGNGSQMESGSLQPADAADTAADRTSTLSETLSIALVAFGTAAAVMILLRNLRRANRKSREMDRPARDRLDELRDHAATSTSLHATMAQTQDAVQRMVGQLEAKAVRVESLLDLAEQRLADYQARLAELESRAALLDRASNPDQARTAPGSSTPHYPSPAMPAADPLHRRVHELADQGLSPVEIARRIDRPTGQIELILALRRSVG